MVKFGWKTQELIYTFRKVYVDNSLGKKPQNLQIAFKEGQDKVEGDEQISKLSFFMRRKINGAWDVIVGDW